RRKTRNRHAPGPIRQRMTDPRLCRAPDPRLLRAPDPRRLRALDPRLLRAPDPRPLLVVPKTRNLSRAFDEDLAAIRASPRALRNGVVVLAPRATEPPALMVSCQMWPFV